MWCKVSARGSWMDPASSSRPYRRTASRSAGQGTGQVGARANLSGHEVMLPGDDLSWYQVYSCSRGWGRFWSWSGWIGGSHFGSRVSRCRAVAFRTSLSWVRWNQRQQWRVLGDGRCRGSPGFLARKTCRAVQVTEGSKVHSCQGTPPKFSSGSRRTEAQDQVPSMWKAGTLVPRMQTAQEGFSSEVRDQQGFRAYFWRRSGASRFIRFCSCSGTCGPTFCRLGWPWVDDVGTTARNDTGSNWVSTDGHRERGAAGIITRFWVLDSGCGRTIIGLETLSDFEKMLNNRNMPKPSRRTEYNSFRFGNGATEISTEVAMLPCFLAGRRGVISAAVVQGKAPLLISRGALQTLKACLDFQNNQVQLFDDRVVVPLATNSAGQYVINLLDKPDNDSPTVEDGLEPLTAVPSQEALPVLSAVEPASNHEAAVDSEFHELSNEPCQVPQDSPCPAHECPETPKYVWIREDWGNSHGPIATNGGPQWEKVKRRIIRTAHHGKILWNEEIDHSKPRKWYHHKLPAHVEHTITEFHHDDPCKHDPKPPMLSQRDCRRLQQQVMSCVTTERTHAKSKRMMVVEVFSPHRFAEACQRVGLKARSIDLITGQDLTVPATCRELEQDLKDNPPELLILCPPCTDEGGWFHLNKHKWPVEEYLRRITQSRNFIKYCCAYSRTHKPVTCCVWKFLTLR